MFTITKFYRYEGNSYRVEEDPEGKHVACYELQLDGTWQPVSWGCQVVAVDNLTITEEQAYLYAGVKKPQ